MTTVNPAVKTVGPENKEPAPQLAAPLAPAKESPSSPSKSEATPKMVRFHSVP